MYTLLGDEEALQDTRALRFASGGALALGGTDKQSLSVAHLLTPVQPLESALTEH